MCQNVPIVRLVEPSSVLNQTNFRCIVYSYCYRASRLYCYANYFQRTSVSFAFDSRANWTGKVPGQGYVGQYGGIRGLVHMELAPPSLLGNYFQPDQ